MKAAELRKLDNAGLKKELETLFKAQLRTRVQKGQTEMKQNHLFKSMRRDIARINTILREKQRIM